MKINSVKIYLVLSILTILILFIYIRGQKDKNLSPAIEEISVNKDNWKSHLLFENKKYNYAKVTDNEKCYLYLTDKESIVSLPDYTESKIDCEFVFRVNDHIIYRSKPIGYIQELSDPIVRSTKYNYYNLASNKSKIIYDKQNYDNSEFKIIGIDSESESIFVLNNKNYKIFKTQNGDLALDKEGTIDQDFMWKSIGDLNTGSTFSTTSTSSMSVVDKAVIHIEGNIINISLDTPLEIRNSEYTYDLKINSENRSFEETLRPMKTK